MNKHLFLIAVAFPAVGEQTRWSNLFELPNDEHVSLAKKQRWRTGVQRLRSLFQTSWGKSALQQLCLESYNDTSSFALFRCYKLQRMFVIPRIRVSTRHLARS